MSTAVLVLATLTTLGDFTNMRYTDEHAYGYSVQLWRSENQLMGFLLASAGLAGDTPTGRLENIEYDPKSGRLRFMARLTLGTDSADRPTRDIFHFDGKLTPTHLVGEISQSVSESPSAPLKMTVFLRPAADPPPDFKTAAEWEKWAGGILEVRGPKWKPIEQYLARDLDLPEASYPEDWAFPPPIKARQAVRFAVEALESRGVQNGRVCHLEWIAAPLGAAVFHATGDWQKGGARFNAFAIGLHDGTEAKHGNIGGTKFMFLARGVDAKKRETYFDGEKVRPYSDMRDPIDELIFEFVSRETLTALPKTCN